MFEAVSTTLNNFIEDLSAGDILNERVNGLNKMAEYIKNKNGQHVNLIFICTHNSRRSHLAHVFAQTAAEYYGLTNISTFSGGTEKTKFNENAVYALKKCGFEIKKSGDEENPLYHVKYSNEKPPVECFSKEFNEEPNPNENFAAVMVCSSADEACPFIPGADARFSIPYEDPKKSDGTGEEEKVYFEKCKEIAADMFYVFGKVV